MSKEVRENRAFFVAPPRAFPLSLLRSRNSGLIRIIHTLVDRGATVSSMIISGGENLVSLHLLISVQTLSVLMPTMRSNRVGVGPFQASQTQTGVSEICSRVSSGQRFVQIWVSWRTLGKSGRTILLENSGPEDIYLARRPVWEQNTHKRLFATSLGFLAAGV